MTTLPAFSAESRCPKCGHDDIGTAYRRSAYDCPYGRKCGASMGEGEHLDRNCRRCHYQWAEAVIAQAVEGTA